MMCGGNKMSFDVDLWMTFLEEHWVIVAIAIIAIFVIMKVVKTILKWVLVAVIIIAIVTYSGYSIDDIKSRVSDGISTIGGKVTKEAQDQAIKAMVGEASEATYVDNKDGSYSITTTNLELSGMPNTGEVTVKYRGAPLGTWKLEGAVRDIVVQSRAAAK
jgi:hypothetical protein